MADMCPPLPELRSSPCRKRSHDGEIIGTLSAATTLPRGATFELTTDSTRQPSPVPSTTSSSLSELTTSVTASTGVANPSSRPAKKPKLTYSEREAAKTLKQQQKADRERQKNEDKARKEEEKRLKDEGKRRREEEKEVVRREKEHEKAEKQKIKDDKKRAKEAEKAREEAEKLRKERSQMRLGAFFGRPATVSTPPSTPDDVFSGVSSRRSSIASFEDIGLPDKVLNATTALAEEFTKWLPPFFVKENMDLAPINRFWLSREQPGSNDDILDRGSSRSDIGAKGSAALDKTFAELKGRVKRMPTKIPPMKALIEQIHGISTTPIDLTHEKEVVLPQMLVEKIPLKYLCYAEDVRPPYRGTYTKTVSRKSSQKLSRNPFHRGLPDTDYDYDSEAEWEEPDPDDEELNNDDDKSEDEEEDEDMEEFLDDENDLTKRRMITGDVQPVSTGLCWQGSAVFQEKQAELEGYAIDVLNDEYKFPIDPYSFDYWKSTSKQSPTKVDTQTKLSTGNLMQPPRLPLSALNTANLIVNQKSTQTPSSGTILVGNENLDTSRPKSIKSDKPLKMISKDLLPAFKQAVEGSDLTKAGLQEVLKKQFPKVTKDVIKDTLSVIAVRVGAKEAEKKWVLL